MPYHIEKKGDKFCVINENTGKNKGCSPTKERAIAHQRLLYGIEGGMKPRDQKKSK